VRAPSVSRNARTRSVAAGSISVTAAVAIATTILAASCAAPLKLSSSADPLGLLSPDDITYLRLSGKACRELAPSFLGEADRKSASPLLERTRIAAIGLKRAGLGGRALDAGFEAALIGDYPFRAASLSLGSNPEWKKVGSSFYNPRLGLVAEVPGPTLAIAGSAASGAPSSGSALESLKLAAKSPHPSPIPARLSALASSEILLWAPRPFSGLAASIQGEEMDVPAAGLLIAAAPSAADAESYEIKAIFLMDDASGTRIYKAALKLAWYALAKELFREEAETALQASFAAEGELFSGSFSLSRQTLGRVVGRAFSSAGSGGVRP
jgi:hypothetical protein